MEKVDCRIAVTVFKSGAVKVEFLEGHVRKRELLRIIKSLKIEHKILIRNYRKKMLESKKEVKTVVTANKNIITIKEN